MIFLHIQFVHFGVIKHEIYLFKASPKENQVAIKQSTLLKWVRLSAEPSPKKNENHKKQMKTGWFRSTIWHTWKRNVLVLGFHVIRKLIYHHNNDKLHVNLYLYTKGTTLKDQSITTVFSCSKYA